MSPRPSKSTPKSNFSKRLKILIQGEPFSSFEAKCSLSNNSIIRYYAGQQPKLDALQAICMATGCDANWLLLGKGEPFPNKSS
jgi:hypothetical protein